MAPLYFAAMKGGSEVVFMPIRGGPVVNQATTNGGFFFYLAAWFGHIEVAVLLISSGAAVNLGEGGQKHGRFFCCA